MLWGKKPTCPQALQKSTVFTYQVPPTMMSQGNTPHIDPVFGLKGHLYNARPPSITL